MPHQTNGRGTTKQLTENNMNRMTMMVLIAGMMMTGCDDSITGPTPEELGNYISAMWEGPVTTPWEGPVTTPEVDWGFDYVRVVVTTISLHAPPNLYNCVYVEGELYLMKFPADKERVTMCSPLDLFGDGSESDITRRLEVMSTQEEAKLTVYQCLQSRTTQRSGPDASCVRLEWSDPS